MAASSSSTPRMEKNTKVSQIQQNFKKPNYYSSSEATSLIKRQETVFKKARELSVLCGIQVCVICYRADGELETWPEDREEVKDIARRYSELSEKKRRKGSVNLHESLEKIKRDNARKKKKRKVKRVSQVKYPVWDPRFDNYSVEQLTELIQSLEHNLTRIQHRTSAVVMAQGGQRQIHNTNMANQELTMTTKMNHLQQPSNQVSMFLVNHGNGTFSRIPVSASAMNQVQSLASIPPELTMYPNSNVGSYSSLLGVQETGINGFQNMNMFNNNNNNNVNDFSNLQNSNVESYCGLLEAEEYGINEFENTNRYSCNNTKAEDYAGLLGMQETGTNALQNMNMYGYNYNNSINANGLSHQLGQFPTQTAAPGYQFGSVQTQY